MKQLDTQGIVLRRINYGEADRIITFLTADYGKIRVMAKGVRKQKSKLAGGIELFSVSELHFIKGRGDIDTLISSRLVKHYGSIVKDLERTNAAYDMLKLIDKTLEDTAGNEYFEVVDEALAALNTGRIDTVVVELSFAMRLLQLLGHVPDFSKSASGEALDKSDSFEFDLESVAFKSSKNGPYNQNHLKVLKLLAHNSPQSVVQIIGIEDYCQQLAPLVRSLLNFYAR